MVNKDEYYPFIDGGGLESIYEREGWDKKRLHLLFDFLKRLNSFDTFECWADTGIEGRMNVLSCGADTPFLSIFDIGEGEPSSVTLFDARASCIDEVAKVTIIEKQLFDISIRAGSKLVKGCLDLDELRSTLDTFADGLLAIQEEDDV